MDLDVDSKSGHAWSAAGIALLSLVAACSSGREPGAQQQAAASATPRAAGSAAAAAKPTEGTPVARPVEASVPATGATPAGTPTTEPELTLAALRRAVANSDWTTVRTMVASDAIVRDLRMFKNDFVESFLPACERKRNETVCGWNGDGSYFELTMQEEAAGWRVTALQFEAIE